MAYTREAGRAFWFEFDKKTKYDRNFMRIIGRAGGFDIQDKFSETRAAGTYPQAFLGGVSGQRQDWVAIADLQKTVIERHFGNVRSDLQSAFEDFGQGTLLDTDPIRQRNNDSIHTMDVQNPQSPPIGYHRWHASVRAIQLLGIGDAQWWENLDTLIGLAWAIQSFARPRQQNTPNLEIARTDLQELRDAWLPLSPAGRDRQYETTLALGYHPSPKLPMT